MKQCQTKPWEVATCHPSGHVNHTPTMHTDEPPVCAVTQAQSARPLNMTIDEITYHTPAAAATHKQPDPRAQHPNTHTYAMTDEIWYHTPAAAGLPSMHETPPNKNTNGKPMCAATCNSIQEPATTSQNEYHTPASVVAWKEQPKLLLCVTLKIFFMNYHTPTQADSTTHLLGWAQGVY
ncbi:hypothetical protein BS47DRAFT_1365638 [Hydnum rufescens UP504]|uniref:Uncharacterized protein n=1 Tax=Hydnum rufescens UP504 TaxID=1448309 RepID=A0A9P6AN79_9AGAM|nr:hypothetical protein BS47DRAFT_1365638 [Hydnum rufescens UP504]